MIEIEYKQENEEETQQEGYFHIPKNIRQMGDVQHGHKIYIEDYVYTYLMHQVDESLGVGRVAILLGKSHWMNGNSYLFIYSAFLVEKMEVSREVIDFTSSIWGGIYETIRQYFPGQEIVGWFLSVPGFSMDIESAVYRAHLNHFGGSDKTLFAMDSVEKDEAFYLYENGVMVRQKGYYVFYEKNDPMQAFLVAANQERRDMEEQEEVEDDAVHSFRRILQGKQETRGKVRSQKFVYGLSTVLIAAVLVLGVTYVQNATKLKLLEKTISQMTAGEGADGAAGAKTVSTETDTTVKTGADTSSETGADTSSETGVDTSSETGADTTSETGADVSSETGADALSETGADASSETGADALSETGTGTSAETEADASAKTGTGASSETGADASTKTDGDASAKTKADTAAGAESVMSVPKNVQEKAETADGTAAGNSGEEDSTEAADEQNQKDATKKEEEADVSYRIYEVQQGDTISTVCESHYGTIDRVGEICRLNGLSKYDKIYPGQKILLP